MYDKKEILFKKRHKIPYDRFTHKNGFKMDGKQIKGGRRVLVITEANISNVITWDKFT